MDHLPLYRISTAPESARVDDLLSRMTLEEKIGQLTQWYDPSTSPETYAQAIRAGIVGSYVHQHGRSLANTLQKIAREESRLGIPLLFGYDSIHGYRTIFPISLGLSCAWDPDLFEQSQAVSAKETRADGIHWTFAPMCDISRDPRWGRVAETCGEDPYLTSLCVAAAVRGFQGDHVSPDRVIACLKHFVGYGASIGGRDYNATEIPPFTLRNLHLPPFRAGVNAGALTVMSAFNANDGIPAVCDKRILTDILREEWGFEGFVVSDWDSVNETISWGFAADAAQAAQLALQAGNDMEMLSRTFHDTLAASVKACKVSPSEIDTAVRRVLTIKFRLGLFEEEPTDQQSSPSIPADAIKLARECATRSAVLLKNDGILPLARVPARIALIGPFADDAAEMLGSWALNGKAEDVVTLAHALHTALPADTILNVLPGCTALENTRRTKTHTDGTLVETEAVSDAMSSSSSMTAAVDAAKSSDLVILALGEPAGMSGENGSRASLRITGRQQELFDAVAQTKTPIIVILFAGRPLIFPEIAARANAVMMAWQPGIQAGPALADLLLGKRSPSGRLTISFPVTEGQVPVYYNRMKTGRPWAVNYRDLSRNPAYPFGYGLTYTQFEYGPVTLQDDIATVTITNTGAQLGIETVQLYIRALSCSEGARPEQELRGFQRVELEPGQSRQIQFALTDDVLGFIGRDGTPRVENGAYHIWIAPHAGTGEPVKYIRSKPAL